LLPSRSSGYEDATFEPRLDLVWLGKDGQVDALDLREESPKPSAS
jgi:hypothetical protein